MWALFDEPYSSWMAKVRLRRTTGRVTSRVKRVGHLGAAEEESLEKVTEEFMEGLRDDSQGRFIRRGHKKRSLGRVTLSEFRWRIISESYK